MLSLLLPFCLVHLVGVNAFEAPKFPRATTNSSSTTLPTGSNNGKNCSWSWSSWDRAQRSAESFTSDVMVTTYTYHNLSASTTIGCDDITRIVGDLTTVATGTNVSTTTSYYTIHYHKRYEADVYACARGLQELGRLWQSVQSFGRGILWAL